MFLSLPLSRRTLLAGALTAGFARAGSASSFAVDPDARAALAKLEQKSGGRLGVHALDTASGRSLGFNDNTPFALCSTFKFLLAAAVLHRHDRDAGVLDRRLRVRRSDILHHSPVTSQHVKSGFITVREACHATVTVSDNAAANLLLPLVGGPQGLTAFLRRHGEDPMTRLDRTELALNSNLEGDLRDTTTPRAMAETTRRLLTGDPLSEASRRQLSDWLQAATTGLARVRAGLPRDWRTGDKTGTCERGAVNDVAITWPPGRPPIVVAVYMSGSTQPLEALNAVHAEVGALVAARLGEVGA
ncbi:class A beta-lactamase [Aquabacterium sp. A7-Y]|uniref:class A beta-lactamase n=1 Tax=Aquabacterium sp. A7-Y TaxID=1349605 RepID=UPI00223CAE62|nr:class A beta-lactamase [Aquabacterium sp. A7-Y]MCW7538594.1 class A beta-lactamase [Aquabacterium sp. A7-Y]